MKISVRALRQIIKEEIQTRGPVKASELPTELFDFTPISDEELSTLSPQEIGSRIKQFGLDKIAPIRSIINRAMGTYRPGPGVLGLVPDENSLKRGITMWVDNSELKKFKSDAQPLEQEYSRLMKARDAAYREAAEAEWKKLPTKEKEARRAAEKLRWAIYGGDPDRGRGLGT